MIKVRGVNRNSKETEHDQKLNQEVLGLSAKYLQPFFIYILFVISKNLNNEININKRRIKMNKNNQLHDAHVKAYQQKTKTRMRTSAIEDMVRRSRKALIRGLK